MSDIIDKSDRQRLVAAIQKAEKNTSGEIRIHIENTCPEELMDRAAFLFEKLKMHKTELRNGVLFYLAMKDRVFAVLGDAGINSKVPEGFWDNIKAEMTTLFKNDDPIGAIETGVLMAGEQLQSHFPYQSDDVNELSDEISFGK
ncbi:TLP18.3, Psb32 and MOLO-1 founding protein of phosphatase [Saccharicrinis carchari]|uniref:TLP18.3, Psb32 and MOLO-1 founding protein of phosphatase n=1 Tax=Saccharicrinis carchari TaxID=1168039 RepID=A0A521AN74_SACCC|nr:TPM domain-containing protein [Saccharicrinis carchari]SMO36263.1 TLP18.3, Psb32 and MOLO-1 founding protein of phosphatase [Saccharicrinis carchari]